MTRQMTGPACGITPLLMIVLTISLNSAGASAQQAVALFALPTTLLGYVSSVKVWLPVDYADFPNRRYVTFYLFDAQSDALFDYVCSTMQYLISEGQLNPVILIGVSTTQRQYDFTPAPQTGSGKSDFARSGGADDYFRYLSREVVPAVEQKYRCEPFRVGIGHSLGATFLIDCMLSHRELFNGCIAISPNLQYDQRQMARSARAHDLTRVIADRFLYLANGKIDPTEEKFRPATEEFNQILTAAKSPDFLYQYDELNNDSHGNTVLEGVPKGLVALYRHFVFPDDQFVALSKGDLARLKENMDSFYSENAQWSGRKLPSIWDFNNTAYNLYYLGQHGMAEKMFRAAISAFPDDTNLLDSLGDVLQMSGDAAGARKAYGDGLSLVEKQKSLVTPGLYSSKSDWFHGRLQSLPQPPQVSPSN
jgi:predicted alpha/beta superfamily hydrolase